jgi:hypothetical protein
VAMLGVYGFLNLKSREIRFEETLYWLRIDGGSLILLSGILIGISMRYIGDM